MICKTLIKDIIWCSKDDIMNGLVDPTFIINEIDCINMTPKDVFDIVNKVGMEDNENIIIPKDSEIIEIPIWPDNEYVLRLPSNAIIVIAIQDIEKYL